RDDNLMKMVREIQEAKRTIISAQEEMQIAASKAPVFKAGKELKEAVK
ncbi:DUF3967 domain-containing protein, partial [Bacillus thuringiensis]|nr:DUF3967 domain-containing protein [Bacillus thuringiensis]